MPPPPITEIASVINAGRRAVPHGVLDHLHRRAVAEGWSADALRTTLWDAMTGDGADLPRPTPPASVAPDPNDPVVVRDAMADAIAVRGMHGYRPATSRYAEFLDMRPTQMAAELLRRRGEPIASRDPLTIAERALTATGDFPALLAAAANKMLLAGYAPARPTYREIFRRRDFRDFKPHRHLRAGDFPSLQLLPDPMAAPVYVYGYLDGATGPQVSTGPVQGVDGVEVSVLFDFGVGAIDWRGGWFNPGT